MLLTGFGFFLFLLSVVLFILAAVALVMAAITREDAYRATDKKTKRFWVGILGAVALVNLLGFTPFSLPFLTILQIAGLVATIVFFVDVRPAVRGISGGGRGGWRRRGGSSSDGPYGPYNGGR
jgi:choline-glycine betaine transporter